MLWGRSGDRRGDSIDDEGIASLHGLTFLANTSYFSTKHEDKPDTSSIKTAKRSLHNDM